jgi:hypothetical protein
MPISEPILYEQDAEFCRYQDNLKWSRFQTAAVLQAALAYVAWTLRPGHFTTILVSAGGLIFLVLLWFVSSLDHSDYISHLNRIKAQEKKCPDFPFERPLRRMAGRGLMHTAWLLLCLFDILLLMQSFMAKPF